MSMFKKAGTNPYLEKCAGCGKWFTNFSNETYCPDCMVNRPKIINIIDGRADMCGDGVWDYNEPSVLYICDRRRCQSCNPECSYTSDISHAKNFEKIGDVCKEVPR